MQIGLSTIILSFIAIISSIIYRPAKFVIVSGLVVTSVILSQQLHIVHVKKDYDDLETALSDPEGVAVLGFLFEVTILNLVLLKTNGYYRKDLRHSAEMCILCIFPFSDVQNSKPMV